MRLEIRYVCSFDYPEPVRESVNELRVCPVSDGRQQLVSYRVSTDPPARINSLPDYWGTRVDHFGIRTPHTHMRITAESVVETSRSPLLTSAPRMSQLTDPEFRELHLEYLDPSPHVDWGEAVALEARKRADAVGDDVVSVVLALHRTAGTMLTYTPGVTEVGTSVDEVLARREGVCQDFAHLVIAMCRSLGIPCRYTSGYLFTSDDSTGADAEGDVVHVATHAWVEAAVPGVGWWALDPTNTQEVSERHVKIGHGRDYDDVPPLKGVFSGPSAHELEVDVEMRRGQATPEVQRPRKPFREQPPARLTNAQAAQQQQ